MCVGRRGPRRSDEPLIETSVDCRPRLQSSQLAKYQRKDRKYCSLIAFAGDCGRRTIHRSSAVIHIQLCRSAYIVSPASSILMSEHPSTTLNSSRLVSSCRHKKGCATGRTGITLARYALLGKSKNQENKTFKGNKIQKGKRAMRGKSSK